MSPIDLNVLPIEADELLNIKIKSNGLVLYNFNQFIQKVSPEIGISVNDILEIFGAKEGKYQADKVEQAVKYSLLSDEDKKVYTQDQISLFDEILKYKRESMQKLIQSPLKIIEVLIKDGIQNNEPVGLFSDFMDLLALATGQNKSRIFLSDYDIWAEIFTRIIFKKQGEANKSFFIMNALGKLIESIPLLSFIKKES